VVDLSPNVIVAWLAPTGSSGIHCRRVCRSSPVAPDEWTYSNPSSSDAVTETAPSLLCRRALRYDAVAAAAPSGAARVSIATVQRETRMNATWILSVSLAAAAAAPAAGVPAVAAGSGAASGAASAAGVDPATTTLIAAITIFALAVFVGVEIITKIPPTLHTPLMSGSNAISGITVVGALLAAGGERTDLSVWLGFLAVALATVNVVGGFLVTHRMLQKFRR